MNVKCLCASGFLNFGCDSLRRCMILNFLSTRGQCGAPHTWILKHSWLLAYTYSYANFPKSLHCSDGPERTQCRLRRYVDVAFLRCSPSKTSAQLCPPRRRFLQFFFSFLHLPSSLICHCSSSWLLSLPCHCGVLLSLSQVVRQSA